MHVTRLILDLRATGTIYAAEGSNTWLGATCARLSSTPCPRAGKTLLFQLTNQAIDSNQNSESDVHPHQRNKH